MQPLTKKQSEILNYIKNYLDRYDYAPSFREIAESFAFSSVATVAGYINSLKEKGYLTNSENLARSIQLTPVFDERSFEILLLGTIAAGRPIQAIRTNETIDIPRDMMQKDVFALKVRGDSMTDEGILDGDYAIIQKTSTPKNGDIVVALLENDSATLKKFFKEKNRIRLEAANTTKKYPPIYTKEAIIQGKLLGVIRKFI